MNRIFLVLLMAMTPLSQADCLKASDGQVFCGAGACDISGSGIVSCSMFKFGDAEVNDQGRVECGRGLCLKNSTGRVFCSIEEDGGAALNISGQVKCYGGCEPGSESMCESLRGL